MERSTIFNGKIHYKWPFSIAMLQITRGYVRLCTNQFGLRFLVWLDFVLLLSMFIPVCVVTPMDWSHQLATGSPMVPPIVAKGTCYIPGAGTLSSTRIKWSDSSSRYWFQKNTTICSKQFRCWYWFWCESLLPVMTCHDNFQVRFCIHCQFRAKSLSHRTAQEKRELREVGLGNPSRSSKVGVCGTLPWKNLPMSYQSTQCKCFGKILTWSRVTNEPARQLN